MSGRGSPAELARAAASLIAMMVGALALEGGEKVLEIGTGYGYQTALLANLAREVWSVELWPDMTAAARRALDLYGRDGYPLERPHGGGP
jgi:protein-L-isoaspartate O-methyltransferase